MTQTLFRTFNVPAMYVAIRTVRFGTYEYDAASLDTSVDWTAEDVVKPVKNQLACASFWAFSATDA